MAADGEPGVPEAGGRMRAVVLRAYGPPENLEVVHVAAPTPKAGEVLVRVQVTTVTAGDAELRTMKVPWLFRVPLRLWLGALRPRAGTILGMELAGTVEAVGEGVRGFAAGDAVVAASDMGRGAHAELVSVPVTGLIAKKPEGVSFEQAAPVPIGGLAALGYLRKGGIQAGQEVLIRGASGSIGTYAVQLARHFGAQVTAVCGPESTERVERLGAATVIDYTVEDWTQNGVHYDLILDVVGRMPISQCLRRLKPGGAYVRGTIPGLWEVLVALGRRLAGGKRVVLGDAGGSSQDLAFLLGLLERGELISVIDRRFTLPEIAQAHRHAETGHKQGHVVVSTG